MRAARFFEDRHGRVIVAQWPNPPLVAWAVLWAAARLRDEDVLGWAATGALVAWAADELARGASPFRRVLGAVVLVVEVLALVRAT